MKAPDRAPRNGLDAAAAQVHPRPCANERCSGFIAPNRRAATLYCTPACSAQVRSARYRSTPRGRTNAAEYRRSRAGAERERAARRRTSQRLSEQSVQLTQLRASVDAALPRTAAQIEAVRAHVADLSAQVDGLRAERDAALADARRLARLVRHLFLTTGAPGFARSGVQALLGAHLSGADRRQVPAGYTAQPAPPPADDGAGTGVR